MKSEPYHFYLSCISWLLLITGCAAPQYLWPQKDIEGSDAGMIPGKRTVLIASRSSEYKKQLVAELQDRLSAAQISHQTIGVKQLDGIDPADYAAVVIINTCLGWGLDRDVSAFLDRQKTTANIIILTTSAQGSWLPDKRGGKFDAVSGASIKSDIDKVAQDLMEKIKRRL